MLTSIIASVSGTSSVSGVAVPFPSEEGDEEEGTEPVGRVPDVAGEETGETGAETAPGARVAAVSRVRSRSDGAVRPTRGAPPRGPLSGLPGAGVAAVPGSPDLGSGAWTGRGASPGEVAWA
ncbi:hypothetical protein ACWES4_18910, partial [Streptomyces sp. NPDC004011]